MLKYEPQLPELQKVWARLSEGAKVKRHRQAQRREALLFRVAARRGAASERAAFRRILPRKDRTSLRRWQERYERLCLDGLVDQRMGRKSLITPELHSAICTLRRIDPDMPVLAIVAHLKKHHAFNMSERTVNEVLLKAGLSRQPGPQAAQAEVATETRLELGGMKLVEAADVALNYTASLAAAVMASTLEAVESSVPRAVDATSRDGYGRFLPSYNQRYVKGAGDDIGPGFASVASKRPDKDMRRLHLVRDGAAVVERKLGAVLVSPVIATDRRWDGMRTPRGQLLEELVGFPYMPATLEQFTRELKYVGVSSTLWEVHARLTLAQTKHWGQGHQAIVLYADGSTKGIWTSLFTKSCKVSNVGRVMPGLDLVSLHTGYGVPFYMATHSGHAPLVNEIPDLLTLLDEELDEDNIMRVVVIDAEGNSVAFLVGLERNRVPRGWVTCLKGSIMAGKKVTGLTAWAPYRDGDRIRAGTCELNDPNGGKFPIRVIEIERRTKGSVTSLGASTLLHEEDFSATEIANMYFNRWPNQEANFRAVNQAVGFKDVHGYGKELVANISVISRLEELGNALSDLDDKEQTARAARQREEAKLEHVRARYDEVTEQEAAATSRLEAHLESGDADEPQLLRLAKLRGALREEIAGQAGKVARAERTLGNTDAVLERTRAKAERYQHEAAHLDGQREIFRNDVELDSLLTLLKVGLVFLVTYVLREFLGGAAMAPATFLARVATLPARLRLTPQLEIVTFDYNHRDPDAMVLLSTWAANINQRKLPLRSGKILCVHVDPPPPPLRPPPTRKRTKSSRWTGG